MRLVFPVLLFMALAAPASADVTDRLTRTLPLQPDVPITVQITVGDVKVIGWDRADVSIEVARRAPDRRQLDRLPVIIEQGTDGLLVRVVQAENGREAALRSDLVLRVPKHAQLRQVELFEGRLEIMDLSGACSARVERGDIKARNVSGTLRFETEIGGIHLDGATLVPDGLIRLRTFNGNITLDLAARPAHARILATSMGGTIASDIPLTRQERWGPRFGETTIGKGEPLISIDVVNGNVAISAPSGNP